MGHRRSKPLGLAIEQSGIRYVRLNNKKSWSVARKSMLPLPKGLIVDNEIADREGLRTSLQKWVRKAGLRGASVSLSIPPSQVVIRKMAIPSTNRKQVEQLVRLEVETGMHLPFEGAVYDYVTTDLDESSTQLLVYAAPGALIDSYIELLDEVGLKVHHVEITATALSRAVVLGEGFTFSETMLIHLDGSMLDVYLFHGGHPLFLRTINLVDLSKAEGSGSMWADEAAAGSEQAAAAEEAFVFRYGAVEEEELTSEQLVEITAEISRMMNFYQYSLHDGSTRITDVIVTGPASGRTQLLRELNQLLPDLNIRQAAFDGMKGRGSDKSRTDMNEYRVALGAALSGRGVNDLRLLPKEDREAQIFPYLALTLLVVWLLGVFALGWWFVLSRGDNDMLSSRIQALQDQRTMYEAQLTAINSGGAGSDDPQQIVSEIMSKRMDAVAVLNELDGKLPKGGVIREIGYNQYGEISLTVNVLTMEDASGYLAKLRTMSFAVQVSIQKLMEAKDDGFGGAAGGSAQTIKPKYAVIYQINTNTTSAAAPSKEGDHAGEDQP